ncbi:MAG: N-6 DNA methylase [Solirubrobacterales bacterium]|nr:N-6 DNA methylase [Solirubrobacterales bacterium]
MQPDLAIAELVSRVRARGPTEPEAIKAAFRQELRRVQRGFEKDPSAWGAWADGRDVIGTAYERLLTGAVRRPDGQFQTPFWAADVMAGWLLQEPVDLLLDPGVGAGRLLFRAMKRRGRKPKALLGLDIDPVALSMAQTNLRLRNIGRFELRKLNFLLRDLPERPSAITCNPPFSRWHDVDPLQRELIHSGFEDRLGLSFHRTAGLHVLFLVRALEVAAPDARIAFITPAEWLDLNYGQAIKRFVLEHAQIEAMIQFGDDHLLFDGARTTAAITLLRKGQPNTAPTRILRLGADLPEPAQVLASLAQESSPGVEQVLLDVGHKWSRRRRRRRRGTPLRELARVQRGVATGAIGFFVISEQTRIEHDLQIEDLRPCIASPRFVEGLVLRTRDLELFDPEMPRWILECRDAAAEKSATSLGAYLRYGKRIGAHATYLAGQRELWYALETRESAQILFTYLNRRRPPRFIRNESGAVPLNTFLIVEPADGVDSDALCAALNAPGFIAQLKHNRRNYGAVCGRSSRGSSASCGFHGRANGPATNRLVRSVPGWYPSSEEAGSTKTLIAGLIRRVVLHPGSVVDANSTLPQLDPSVAVLAIWRRPSRPSPNRKSMTSSEEESHE